MKNPTWPKALAFIGFAIFGLALAYYSTAIATAGVTAKLVGSDRSGDWISTGSAVLMVGDAARFDLTEIRAAEEEHRADGDEPAAQVIGDDGKQDGAAEDRAHRVRALRNGDNYERRDEEAVIHEAERRDREAPCGHREEHGHSLALQALRPPRTQGRDERSDARRREEESEPLGTDREHTIGIEREERARRSEERREEIEQHGPEEDAVGSEVGESLDERAADRQMDAYLARRRDECGHGADRDDE